MTKEKIYNLPNLLSAYRIVALPFITWSIFSGERQMFICLLCINLVTDILDGLIARTFKLATEFGARLDSIADVGTYLMAFTGMIVLETEFVAQHLPAFLSIIGLFALAQLVTLVRFGRSPSLHLYSFKITGYIQGIFIFTHFVFGHNELYFYFMCICSYMACLEEIIIVTFIPELRSNVRGLYFILKEHKKII